MAITVDPAADRAWPGGPPASDPWVSGPPEPSAPAPAGGPTAAPRTGVAVALQVAGMASLGAGAIHAAAIGVHSEHRPAAIAFTAIAAVQLAWGGLALARSGRLTAALGVLVNGVALGGFVLAKTRGISFVEGMETAEPTGAADGLAAGLALAATVLPLLAFLPARSRTSARLHARPASNRAPIALAAFVAPLVLAASVGGMNAAGSHAHAGGHSLEAGAATDGHAHGHDGTESATGASGAAGSDAGAAGHDHGSPAVAPVPYDPDKPIDLGGVPGVTPEQQADAENIVAETLLRLPQWSDPQYALANGFHTIGDGFTGTEHLINESFLDDDSILDPDRPESLVFDTRGGGRRLVAAMYMLKRGTPMDQVPDTGGALMQWHIHDDLCFTPNGFVGGITSVGGTCPPPLVKPVNTPMIHVWIESHRCGPFAALEGIGGGQVAEGETKLCDHAHGAAPTGSAGTSTTPGSTPSRRGG